MRIKVSGLHDTKVMFAILAFPPTISGIDSTEFCPTRGPYASVCRFRAQSHAVPASTCRGRRFRSLHGEPGTVLRYAHARGCGSEAAREAREKEGLAGQAQEGRDGRGYAGACRR